MVVGDAHVFPGILTPALTQLSFQSHRLLFSHVFCRAERRKYAGKKVRLYRGSNSQPPALSPTHSPLSHPGGAYNTIHALVSILSMDKSWLTSLKDIVYQYSTNVTQTSQNAWFKRVKDEKHHNKFRMLKARRLVEKKWTHEEKTRAISKCDEYPRAAPQLFNIIYLVQKGEKHTFNFEEYFSLSLDSNKLLAER